MIALNPRDVMLLVTLALGLFGVIAIIAGLFLLIKQGTHHAVDELANQTATLAQKGIADEVAGLVGNAKGLIDALNQLVRTNAGIGIFLMAFGSIMLLVSFFLVRQVV